MFEPKCKLEWVVSDCERRGVPDSTTDIFCYVHTGITLDRVYHVSHILNYMRHLLFRWRQPPRLTFGHDDILETAFCQ